jgi:predicted metalloprotease
MKWQGRRGSRNIEDRRKSGGGKAAGGIGGVGLIAVLAIGYFMGVDPATLLNIAGGGQTTSSGPVEITQEDQERGTFVSVTLRDTEVIWTEVFKQQLGRTYNPATLVLFKGSTQSPCGGASGASGPFYCPADKKAYLDTSFFHHDVTQIGCVG